MNRDAILERRAFLAAIDSLRPGAAFSVGDTPDYAHLVWSDKQQAKPTEQEVTAKVAEIEASPEPTAAEQLEDLKAVRAALLTKGTLTEADIEGEKTLSSVSIRR